MSAPRRIAIRAGHIIGYHGRGHRYLRDGVIVIEGDRILHVGPRWDGAVDETVDAADRIETTGLISTHEHIGGSPQDRSVLERFGPGAGSPAMDGASTGNGTRRPDAAAWPGPSSSSSSTTAPTAISCGASSRPPRSTRARPSS